MNGTARITNLTPRRPLGRWGIALVGTFVCAMTGCSDSSASTQLSTDREYLAQCGVAGADAYEGGDVEVLIEGVVLEPLPLWIVAATGLLSTAALDGSISLVVKGGELAGARACTAISAVDRDGIGTYSLDR